MFKLNPKRKFSPESHQSDAQNLSNNIKCAIQNVDGRKTNSPHPGDMDGEIIEEDGRKIILKKNLRSAS